MATRKTNPILELCRAIVDRYQRIVQARYPETADWPVLSGWNNRFGSFGTAVVIHLQHTGFKGMIQSSSMTLTPKQVGAETVTADNRASVISKLEVVLNAVPRDILLVVENGVRADGRIALSNTTLDQQLQLAFARHEHIQGLLPMRIFLSHKGVDKPRVRDYKKTLEQLGFEPWIDEDAMAAGTVLERGLLQGFKDSCAAIFFVTANFKDENFLATEVEYALQEKRKKGDKFQIITLAFADGEVPELLKRYVWKQPETDLEGLREILKALPLSVGPVRPR